MGSEIEAAVRQTKRYWFEDGLTEIASGLVLVAIAALFAFEAGAPEGSWRSGVSALGLPVIVLVGTLLAGRIVRALKERYTYPRSGYVKFAAPTARRRWAAGIAAAGVAMILVLAIARLGFPSQRWVPAMDGVAAMIMLWYLAYSYGLVRFYALGLAAAAIGVGASLWAPDEVVGSAWFFAATGAALILVGALVLQRYMQCTRPTGGEAPRDGSAPEVGGTS